MTEQHRSDEQEYVNEPCQRVRRSLTDHLWSPDDLAEAERVAAHLRVCLACQEAAADYGLLRDLLGHDAEPDPLEDGEQDGPITTTGPFGGRAPRHSRSLHVMGGRLWRWPQALAWAAVLALAAVGWWRRPAATPPIDPAVESIAVASTWQPSEAQQQVELFKEVNELFDARTGWVALAGERSDLGLMPQPVTGQQDLMLLRLTLWHDGKLASRADLAVLAGQTAELAVPLADGRELSYRVSVSASRPRELSLWAQLSWPREPGQILAALTTRVPVQVGRVLPAAELVSSAGIYELRISFAHQQIQMR